MVAIPRPSWDPKIRHAKDLQDSHVLGSKGLLGEDALMTFAFNIIHAIRIICKMNWSFLNFDSHFCNLI